MNTSRVNISRRHFVKAGGIASAVVAIPGALQVFGPLNTSGYQSPVERAVIEDSIKANFGAGFQVFAQHQKAGLVQARIEHLENQYLVQSSNLRDWTILSSSVS